jgi:hypothetical protein
MGHMLKALGYGLVKYMETKEEWVQHWKLGFSRSEIGDPWYNPDLVDPGGFEELDEDDQDESSKDGDANEDANEDVDKDACPDCRDYSWDDCNQCNPLDEGSEDEDEAEADESSEPAKKRVDPYEAVDGFFDD